MTRNKFEEMIANTIKLDKKAKPCRWFAFKMRLMLQRKSWQMSWRRTMAGTGKFKVAGVGALITFLTVGGGVGVYAYSSPDVTVMHPLYPIKQGIESTEVYLAPSARLKAEIQLANTRRRMDEMQRIGQIIVINDNRQDIENGMQRTMLMARQQMNDSLAYAADEDSVNDAQEMMDMMQKHLQEMDDSLDGFSGAQMLNEQAAIKNNIQDLRQYTQLKLKKINQVSLQISSPMRIKGPRAILKTLTDDGQGLEEIEMVLPAVPVVQPVVQPVIQQQVVLPTRVQLNFN